MRAAGGGRRRNGRKRGQLQWDATYLQTGALRMALLLLGTLNTGCLATRALAARGLSFSASHGDDEVL